MALVSARDILLWPEEHPHSLEICPMSINNNSYACAFVNFHSFYLLTPSSISRFATASAVRMLGAASLTVHPKLIDFIHCTSPVMSNVQRFIPKA
jgi:hypothetical protein